MGVAVSLNSLLTQELDKGEWLVSTPGHFICREIASWTHSIGS